MWTGRRHRAAYRTEQMLSHYATNNAINSDTQLILNADLNWLESAARRYLSLCTVQSVHLTSFFCLWSVCQFGMGMVGYGLASRKPGKHDVADVYRECEKGLFYIKVYSSDIGIRTHTGWLQRFGDRTVNGANNNKGEKINIWMGFNTTHTHTEIVHWIKYHMVFHLIPFFLSFFPFIPHSSVRTDPTSSIHPCSKRKGFWRVRRE